MEEKKKKKGLDDIEQEPILLSGLKSPEFSMEDIKTKSIGEPYKIVKLPKEVIDDIKKIGNEAFEKYCRETFKSNEEIIKEEEYKRKLKEIYRTIIDVLKDYSDIDDRYYPLISTWIIGTYFHDDFPTFPYLFFNAMRGCLPKGTLIKTPKGNLPIEKIKEVLSYNFKNNKIESTKAIPTNVGLKKVMKIHLKNKIIECSPEHRWFVKTKRGIKLKETRDLNTEDNLIIIEQNG